MKLKSHVCLYRHRGDVCRVDLYEGDLSKSSPFDPVDALVVSAYPGDYAATPKSLIGSLEKCADVSVEKLSVEKAHNHISDYDWWLSRDLDDESVERIRARRILCYEPADERRLVSSHGFLAALISCANSVPEIRTIAMPVLLSGDRGGDRAAIMDALLKDLQRSIEQGVPLKEVRIVEFPGRGDELTRRFEQFKSDYLPMEYAEGTPHNYDVFLSYAHKNKMHVKSVDEVEQRIRAHGRTVFRDIREFKEGDALPVRIYSALHRTKVVVPFLSTAYSDSPWCRLEYQVAYARSIFGRPSPPKMIPVLLEDTPAYNRESVVYFRDCRSWDAKVADALVDTILSDLTTSAATI